MPDPSDHSSPVDAAPDLAAASPAAQPPLGPSERLAAELVAELRARRSESASLYQRHVNASFVELLELVGYGRRFLRSSGMELEDERGERYLDFLSGYGVLNLGHNHPAIKAVIAAVLGEDLPGFTQVDCGLLEGLAAERLSSALPGDLDTVFFCNSGTEAAEAAIKLARAATGRKRILGCENGFHGLTLGALGLHGDSSMRKRFAPLVPAVERIAFDDLGALERALREGNVAAFVVEPIQGEGGAVVPRAGFLPRALELCRRYKALFIVDEVQTGLGRTGKLFAIDHEEVVPDVVLLAKALGGGLVPVGAMVARGEVFRRAYGSLQTCMLHSSTFGGGPVAMAAVLGTLAVLEAEGLVSRAAEQGEYLLAQLRTLQERHRAIAEVRGVGLMLGVRFTDVAGGFFERTLLRGVGRASAAAFAQHVTLRLIEDHRIVTQVAGIDTSVLKVMPPLSVSREQIDRFIGALDTVLAGQGQAGAIASLARTMLKRRIER